MKRRHFILGSLAVGASAGSTGWWATHRRATAKNLWDLLERELPVEPDLIDVANQYLDRLASPSKESLTQAVMHKLEGCPLRTIGDRLRTLVHQDFREDRTVVLDGWLLSETEMQLCGLRLLMEE